MPGGKTSKHNLCRLLDLSDRSLTSFIQYTFVTADILTCHKEKNTDVIVKINGGFIYLCVPAPARRYIVHDIGNVISYTCAFYATVSKYLQWKQPITSVPFADGN